MADPLNTLPSGQVITTSLHSEVQRSYLEYAMSVIVGRALPDVRDGLKPVHRRILYAMHELGLTPDRPYRKCARVVGDVLGKYHPHGDQAVYDALVRMVQTFSSRYPLLDGHGNFGSVDNDPPAAMRYTETRLASVGHEALLGDISEALVDFTDNFDSSQQEPVVLPAQLPNLILNGSSGIAVGMATNIPPHNLGEVVDGLIALIDRPGITDEQLFEIIPGPDFPTGGEIIGTEGIYDAYRTGRGSIPLRGVVRFEEVRPGRGKQRRNAIIVTELPFQVNKAGWIEKIADLVNNGRLDGIADIRDESDREGMRVVIELKREAQAQRVLHDLYRMTPLQTNFGAIMLALEDGQPRQMPLREILLAFLNFREETLTRQYQHELDKTQARLHIIEGLLTALGNLDTVIDILRNAPDGTTAKQVFQQQFDLSERQSDAILAMPLRRLTGLERQNLEKEFQEASTQRNELQRLLNDRKELLKALKKELRSLKKKFSDPRRTRIPSAAAIAKESQQLAEIISEAAEEEAILEFTQKGYVRRSSPRSYQRRQGKQEAASTGTLQEVEDVILQVESALTNQEVLALTRDGRAFTVKVDDIPQAQRQAKGVPLVRLLPDSVPSEAGAVVRQILLTEAALEQDLVVVTRQGRIKRVPLKEYSQLTGRGLTVMKLKDGDELAYAVLARAGEHLVLATSGGRLLRFEIDDDNLPIMGRNAQGPQALRMRKQETLVGCVAIAKESSCVLLISALGFAKRMPANSVTLASRGGLGTQAFQFSLKSDTLAALTAADPGTEATLITTADRVAQITVAKVPRQGRSTPCDRILKLNKGESVAAVTIATLPDNGSNGNEG
ncbi:DNA gyrase subunit A [Pseudanabaena sp. FACHB-2040]|uniref:DNA gyrase subunit A n=1 Tax=Pseudanabaena sp. FACHB-2040 TaxID=2692859 RepID=UPI001685A300|nr:DNA gyrase subunit A [Pseudanabaena sp. FACHB-2040]MBD2260214.1 DNA gyrase subunit A [Pseudanabaena sp. FACHB-2040]